MLILSSYVLLACINRIYKMNIVMLKCFSDINIKFQFLGSGALYLRFELC